MSDLPPSSAVERAYVSVQARILDGSLAGGCLITEGEIARQLGMSRTPVREAFLQLAAEDMLELYPKKGALVVPIDAAGLRDVLRARLLVEPWAARFAAGSAAHLAHADTLQAAAELADAALSAEPPVAAQAADRDFHEVLVGFGESPLISAFFASLRQRQLRGAALAIRRRPERVAEIRREHAAVVTAIRDGDGDAAADAIRRHLRGTTLALGLAPLP